MVGEPTEGKQRPGIILVRLRVAVAENGDYIALGYGVVGAQREDEEHCQQHHEDKVNDLADTLMLLLGQVVHV